MSYPFPPPESRQLKAQTNTTQNQLCPPLCEPAHRIRPAEIFPAARITFEKKHWSVRCRESLSARHYSTDLLELCERSREMSPSDPFLFCVVLQSCRSPRHLPLHAAEEQGGPENLQVRPSHRGHGQHGRDGALRHSGIGLHRTDEQRTPRRRKTSHRRVSNLSECINVRYPSTCFCSSSA